MRIDKYLANLWIVPRRQIKKLLKTWEVLLNNTLVETPQLKIKEWDIISVWNQNIPVKFAVHILLHKPAWYVSSNIDEGQYASYKDLLDDCPYGDLIEIAWRLDVDTEWLLFCSSDGKVIHNIIHPHKKVEKEYYVEAEKNISKKDITALETWVKLSDNSITHPAKVTQLKDNIIQLTITEGKFHQVKRMLEAVDNKVIYLRRDRIWDWKLDGLEKGEWKYVEIWI